MKSLESVKLVQFFLFDSEDIRLGEVAGIFGPNGSGKSSVLDAIQIAMFGANTRLVAFNAQADTNKSTRTMRSYCLGQTGESVDSCVRRSATTYITLVWRDQATQEPLSMGVCLHADAAKDGHEVRGRYMVRGLELTLGDHLETIDGVERPREWAAFRHQLTERAVYPGDDVLFQDGERYIRACLIALRGSAGAPLTEAFTRAFRFALRMRFDRTVDQIVRNDVLEARPTNVKRFKEVTESFRRLAELVHHVEAKIEDATHVEADYARAEDEARKNVTWSAACADVELEAATVALNLAQEAVGKAIDESEAADEAVEKTVVDIRYAEGQAASFRTLKERHAAHAELATTQAEIGEQATRAKAKEAELRKSIKAMRSALSRAQEAEFVTAQGALTAAIEDLEGMAAAPGEHERGSLESTARRAAAVAEKVTAELFTEGQRIQSELAEANRQLKAAWEGMERMQQGKAPLSGHVQRLLTELRDHGVQAEPVCDLVRISDPSWQPVIEAYLGRRVEALLIPGTDADETRAFNIYRGLSGRQAIYGAKLAMESRQRELRSPERGSVAELIEGERNAAVSYVRAQFGDMRRATTDAEALGGRRTLTSDGMLTGGGEIERLEAIATSHLRIGAGSAMQRATVQNDIDRINANVVKLEAKQRAVSALANELRPFAGAQFVATYMLGLYDDFQTARAAMRAAEQKIGAAADEEYVRLVQEEREWGERIATLTENLKALHTRQGAAAEATKQRQREEAAAMAAVKGAAESSRRRRADDRFDADFLNRHWDGLLERFGSSYAEMGQHCADQARAAAGRRDAAVRNGDLKLGDFAAKYREEIPQATAGEWGHLRTWIKDVLARLRDTELREYRAQMDEAYRTSQATFRNDVAIALSNNLDWLETTMDRMNRELRDCPPFTNGERYQFERKVRPHFKSLLQFVKDIAAYGPTEDLLGGAGEIPEQFRELLEDKVAPGAGSVASPLDDFREFFEYDVQILLEDPVAKTTKRIGHLSSRLGPGSGGEHRAPLYVIAGAGLSSAYGLTRERRDSLRLILLDEAFNKMDPNNIVGTMKYLTDLGLQVVMAGPGENLGYLNGFLFRYYDIMRDPISNAVMLEAHDVKPEMREMFRSDLPHFNPELLESELAAVLRAPIRRDAPSGSVSLS